MKNRLEDHKTDNSEQALVRWEAVRMVTAEMLEKATFKIVYK